MAGSLFPPFEADSRTLLSPQRELSSALSDVLIFPMILKFPKISASFSNRCSAASTFSTATISTTTSLDGHTVPITLRQAFFQFGPRGRCFKIWLIPTEFLLDGDVQDNRSQGSLCQHSRSEGPQQGRGKNENPLGCASRLQDIARCVRVDYGKVEEISTTFGGPGARRTVTMTLNNDITLESLPHELILPGHTSLVVTRGRSPLSLCCRLAGPARMCCHVPRCGSCPNFGHYVEGCVRAYARATADSIALPVIVDMTDEAEAEALSDNTTPHVEILTRSFERGLPSECAQEGCDDISAAGKVVKLSSPAFEQWREALPPPQAFSRSQTWPRLALSVPQLYRRRRPRGTADSARRRL